MEVALRASLEACGPHWLSQRSPQKGRVLEEGTEVSMGWVILPYRTRQP